MTMIIGLVGKNASGKGTVADLLTERGFVYTSCSDIIREEIVARGLEVTRENLIETGRDLRREGGPGALAEMILKKLEPNTHYIVDSIRNPGEVDVLRRRAEFVLIEVTASEHVRFARLVARARPGDPTTLEKFRELEARELQSDDSAAQQLVATAALADVALSNDAGPTELRAALEALLPRIARGAARPDWDDYFMGIARMVASRSNCLKRQVAAVLVRDQRIIATGYNGTPRGAPNCNEGGCPRCAAFGPSGTRLDECLCSHAEENAITQAAFHGVIVRDATLYSTLSPCLTCTKMIINAGIREVVYDAHYPLASQALGLLQSCGVVVRKLGDGATTRATPT